MVSFGYFLCREELGRGWAQSSLSLSGTVGHLGDRGCLACDPGLGDAELRAGQVGLLVGPHGESVLLRPRREESHASLPLCCSSLQAALSREEPEMYQGTAPQLIANKRQRRALGHNPRGTQSVSGSIPRGGTGRVPAQPGCPPAVWSLPRAPRSLGHGCPWVLCTPCPF